MTIVMSNNFDGNPGDSFLGDATFTATGPVMLGPSHYGVGVQFQAGVNNYIEQKFTGTTSRVFSRIYRLSANPSATTQIFQARSATGAICSAAIRNTGQVSLHNAGSLGTILASTTPLPLGVDVRVVFTITGNTFGAVVYPDLTSTTAVSTITSTVTGGVIAAAREGNPSGNGVAASTLTLSWPVDDDTADPGPRQYVYLEPSATGGIVPAAVTAIVRDENLPGTTRAYSVDWGDGSTTGPQESNQFSHTFARAGEWQMTPRVDAG